MAKRKPKKNPAKKPKISSPSNTNWLYYAGIFAFGFLLYANTLGHDFVLDDFIVTQNNRFVMEGFAGLKDIFSHGFLFGFNGMNDQSYRPLVLANLAIETALFGSNPGVHHFFNVLFYALSGVILLAFLKRVFREHSIWLPLGITALFLAHPIHTEVVANIKSRDEILSFLFGISCLYCVLKYSDSNHIKWLIAGVTTYFLSILSKETGLAFFGLVPFTLYFFSNKNLGDILKISAVFLGAVILYFIIRFSVMDSITFAEDMGKINNSLMGLSGTEKLATQIYILGKYVWLLIFPHPLSFDYSFNQIPGVGFGNWKVLLSLVAYLAMAGFLVYGLIRKHILSFGVLIFLCMLVLVSNILTQVGATMAERFIYSSSLGFCLIVGYLLYHYFYSKNSIIKNKNIYFALLGVILILYSIKTITRNSDWKNAQTLFASGLVTAPNSARAQNHYASYLRMEAEKTQDPNQRNQLFRESVKYYDKALVIHSEYTEALYNKGVSLFSIGNPAEAEKAYQRVLEIEPNYTNALNNLGVIYFNRKNYPQALSYWKKLLEFDPANSSALLNSGAAHQNSGSYGQAISFYQKVLENDSQNKGALQNIIKCYTNLGDATSASKYQNQLNGVK